MNLARTFLAFVSSLLLSISTWGATVNFYTTNYTGTADTNAFRVYPVGEPILANGGIVTRGLPIKLQPDTNGFVATNLNSGNYLASNAFMVATFAQTYGSTRGILFAVPSGDATHNVADLAISGFNTYNYTAVGSAAFAAADTVVSNGLSARLLATNTSLAAAIVAATNGLTSGTSGALTNNDTREITLATNLTVGGVFSLGGAVEVAAADGDVWNFTSNLRALEFYGNGTGLTNIPLTGVTGLTNALDYLTNNIGGSAVQTNIHWAAVTNLTTRLDLFAATNSSTQTNIHYAAVTNLTDRLASFALTNAVQGSNVTGTMNLSSVTTSNFFPGITNASALATDANGMLTNGEAGLSKIPAYALGTNLGYVRVTSPSPPGTYYAASQTNLQGILAQRSLDGVHWTALWPSGYYKNVDSVGTRDPAMMYDTNTGQYLIAYTRQVALSDYAPRFGVISSTNLTDFNFVKSVEPAGMPSSWVIWAPEWFRDNGTNWVVYCAFDYDTIGGSASAVIQTMAALDNTFTNWSAPITIATNIVAEDVGDAGYCPGLLDPLIYKKDGTYYLFAKFEQEVTPNDNLDKYVTYTNNVWPGATHGFRYKERATEFKAEGIAGVMQFGDQWRFYAATFDPPNGRFFYSDSPVFGRWTNQTFCAEIPIATFGQGTVVPVTTELWAKARSTEAWAQWQTADWWNLRINATAAAYFTNASGTRFSLTVNSTTNGFTFTALP